MIYVVLAAGSARRMGFAKIFTPLLGRTPLERIAGTLEGRKTVAVVPPDRRADAQRITPAMSIVVNAEPERGMTRSLRLGLEGIEEEAVFGVLLADKPFLERATLDRIEDALGGVDVAYPVDAFGVAGHPVVFGPRARPLLARLPEGDTLSLLRDDSSLLRAAVPVDDAGAFHDLDDRAQWEAVQNA